MRTALREIRSRFWALAALAVAVAVAAGLGALFVGAWGTGLPEGARRDLIASPADAVVISRPVGSAADFAANTATVQDALARVAPTRVWHLDSIAVSDVFNLPSGVVDGAAEQTYAVSSTAVRQNAVLVSGAWPGSAPLPGTAIGVAVPVPALEALGLRVGGRLTVVDSVTHAVVAFAVTGSFRYATDEPGTLAWNAIGASGVQPDGPSTYFGPLVADPAVFSGGALATAGGSWVLTPTGEVLDPAVIAAQATALTASAALAPQSGFTVTSGLPALAAGFSARMAAARAQLLAGAILLGLLSGVALAASTGSLVARGGTQAALLCSRGAPRRTLVSFYAADVVIVLLSAVAGVLAQAALWGDGVGSAYGGSATPFAAWVSGLAIALVAALMLCVRAARAVEPADLAAASGRQGSIPGIVRVGGDLVLIVLAGVAVWQAGEVGLSARAADGNGTSPVLIVAAAPALAVAAGAALCGRLVAGAARLFEFVARRARSAPVRLATWELARTPLRYFVPALLCVAAVAGCGSLAAQHAGWLRSAHDQAAFANGAPVAVTFGEMLPLGTVATVGSAPGVIAATPVAEVDIGSGTLLALDAKSAAAAVSLRPDLAGQSSTRLWAGLLPGGSASTPGDGTLVPGRPLALGLTGTLTGTGQAAVEVGLTVQDASGLTYSISVGRLEPDAVRHSLSTVIAPDAEADYPLRIIGVTLDSTSDSARPAAYDLTVSGLTEQLAGGTATSFAGAAALASWSPSILQPDAGQGCAQPGSVVPPSARAGSSPGGGLVLDVHAGGVCTDAATSLTVSMAPSAASGLEVPALATRGYLLANGEHVGSADRVSVNGVTVGVRIVASVAAFPALPAGDPNALIVDLSQLADAVNAGGAELWPTYTWWLSTVDGEAPAALPPGAVVTTASGVQAALTSDPLSAYPQRVLDIAAPALVLLAVLGLVISLLAASRDAAARDTVLSALGTTRSQLAALTSLLHACVVIPAALLGAGLGFLLARVFTPVFVLGADGSPPLPSAVVQFDAPWSVAAVLAVVTASLTAALATCLVRTGKLSPIGAGR
jgi:hypothetical protein